ncbi:GxxExxY protein [Candidatus Jorgensenbacteria bacterium CG_4_10_14_0_8_um_filter_39_13]|uniref:GxxExxY protein n=2 Tax=Candidatus Joergenseniibacteriota TaxID=1752739 RepID=A0A2M7RGG1_9BACT|nr:MAG: GxxExxY protein [Candidatus Jorgensenbacteria bacterium CG11_big_fil_rev_8_21_14_0_20_38_23]PIV13013.1 MAG: GxxExxY protein [Candidatus Jorgensenbacteria bacterium CG03_land_8_20_14_0_80_38_39]PIW97541.1 MAG: GxxExxY protein [Candidatus Jorgensenbacteria bacterium CG_4_8_14_3_um_filter_38_10]PIY95840.1 MAG: GxxExxY protein [Candidatus Jorgensenbacteria bacterium CG_4_10_14_0_8_um_filter_39_13]PJA95036.1 MAG: GxxExxY protein [Candidatus Jorgensenbacteria bacterium CG_4_9_14_3_um_filter_3
MAKLVEKELSYKIIGILFDVYNNLGGGYQEKYYQRAVSQEFKNRDIKFKEQISIPLSFKGISIGRYFLDFLIEDKIILEIKVANKFYIRDVKQVLAYLKATNTSLGILANFNRNNLQFKRILKGD